MNRLILSTLFVPRKTNIYEFFEMGRPGDAKEKLPWTPGGTRHKKNPVK